MVKVMMHMTMAMAEERREDRKLAQLVEERRREKKAERKAEKEEKQLEEEQCCRDDEKHIHLIGSEEWLVLLFGYHLSRPVMPPWSRLKGIHGST